MNKIEKHEIALRRADKIAERFWNQIPLLVMSRPFWPYHAPDYKEISAALSDVPSNYLEDRIRELLSG